ncbi:MAG: PAS domain S-box protein [Flavobacteriales bacterium]|nr:PAS domain S-box protein [Flavobacteriales bacterium]
MPESKSILLKFQSVFECAIDGIILINERGIIEDINQAALNLFGFDKLELLSKNINILIPEPDSSRHDRYLSDYLASGKAKIIGIGREVNGLKKDGTTFPFRLAVSEINLEGKRMFTGIIHDLSTEKEAQLKLKEYAENLEKMVEQRTELLAKTNAILQEEIAEKVHAQHALMDSQKMFAAIAHNFPNGTINVLDKDLNFLFVDGQGLKDLDYNGQHLIGKNFISLLPEEVQNDVKQQLLPVFEGHPTNFEISIKHLIFRVRAVALTDENGETNRILVVESNITQQKNAEQDIYNSLQKEKELNELKSKFVSMASHEFRTPLSTIQSSASLIKKYAEKNQTENITKHTQRIGNNVKNLTMILNDFLSLEKLENQGISASFETFDLIESIKELTDDMMILKKTEQQIELIHNDEHILVHSDRFIIQNALINLVSNAIKYSGDKAKIELCVCQQQNSVTIEVKDNGIGISKEDQEQLFNRFFRASNAGNVQGTGLGLHIVKRYINLIGGRLYFKSELGKGSVFGFEIGVA